MSRKSIEQEEEQQAKEEKEKERKKDHQDPSSQTWSSDPKASRALKTMQERGMPLFLSPFHFSAAMRKSGVLQDPLVA